MAKKPDISHLHHIALKVKDVEKAAAFYREVLNLREITKHHHANGSLRSIWLKISDTILMIEKLEDATPGTQTEFQSPHWHLVAFGIEKADSEIWRKHLESSGIVVERESPCSLYFRDPENNRVCLSFYNTDKHL